MIKTENEFPELSKFLLNHFPTVHKIFSIVRGNGRGERFPILLQAIEANIVLKVILPRINNEYPDIIAFTVHDSLLVTDSPDIVESVMAEELEKFTGYKPILKVEFLTDRNFNTDYSDTREKEEKEKAECHIVYYYDSKTFVII